MSTPTWEFQYSVETDAHREFAWLFWTNVANWSELEPGVDFELDGPFAAGTRGRTRMPGQEPRHWLIRAVDPGRSWTQEMSLPGASFIVTMQFEEVITGRTRITQRLWLESSLYRLDSVAGLLVPAQSTSGRNVSGILTDDGLSARSHDVARLSSLVAFAPQPCWGT